MLNLKNKSERENFLKNYKEWPGCSLNEVFEEIQNLYFYKYTFQNGASVIVTVCKVTKYEETRYNLIIPSEDDFNPFGTYSGHNSKEFLNYNLHGCGISTIVDYMTKRKDVI
jgi:hypothetical protein